LGLDEFQKRHQKAALRYLFKAIKIYPENADAHYLLGIIFLTQMEFYLAKKHLKKALKIRPDFPDALNTLGVVYIHVRQYDKAIQTLKKATSNILYEEIHLAWGNLGWAYIQKKELNLAIKALKRAVFLQPKFCLGYYRLGMAYFLQEKYSLSVRSLEQAIHIDAPECKNFQLAFQLLGQAYLKLKRPQKAVEVFKRCKKISLNTGVSKECEKYIKLILER
jgi:Tfp pilus assembly protein PilF